MDTILWLMDELESLTEFGDLHSMELAKQQSDVKKLQQEIKKRVSWVCQTFLQVKFWQSRMIWGFDIV